MCGIAGIIGDVGDANWAGLRRMTVAMVHRGPDADGIRESPTERGGRGVLHAPSSERAPHQRSGGQA